MTKLTISITGLLLMSVAVWSCKSDEETIKEAENQVFAIHDEVMPKIDNIMKVKKQLKQRAALIDSSSTTGLASGTLRADEEKQQVMRLSRNLNEADSLMSGWMDQYEGDTLAKLKTDDALRYLDEQKNKITDVKTKVNTSLEQARQFLDKK